MKKMRWLLAILGLSLLASACGATAEEPELSPELAAIASAAEAAFDRLDVLQIERNSRNDLEVFIYIERPVLDAEGNELSFEAAIRQAAEVIWDAAVANGYENRTVVIGILLKVPAYTLEHGMSNVGRIIGTVQADLEDLSEYLAGDRSQNANDSLWASEAISTAPLDSIYQGPNNHPLRISFP